MRILITKRGNYYAFTLIRKVCEDEISFVFASVCHSEHEVASVFLKHY